MVSSIILNTIRKQKIAAKEAEITKLSQQYVEYQKLGLYNQLENTDSEEAKAEISTMISEMESIKSQLDKANVEVGLDDAGNAFTQDSIATPTGDNVYTGQTSPSQSSAPNTISGEFMTALLANGSGNKITVVDTNGNQLNSYDSDSINLTSGETLQVGDIVQYGGVSYTARVDEYGNIYGERLMNYGTSNTIKIYNDDGTVSIKDVERVEQRDSDGNLSYQIVVRDDDTTYPEYVPNPPQEPSIQYKDIDLYSYVFGIDTLSLSYNTVEDKACFVSDYIDIGTLNDTNTLALEASDYMPYGTSIEYYIIDEDNTIPIINRNLNYIENELLFEGLPTRFSIKDNNYTISKNFIETSLSLQNIQFNNKDDTYTISYEPIITQYTPINSKVKVKVIMRNYLKDNASPYVKYINLIKTGTGMLWNDISQT